MAKAVVLNKEFIRRSLHAEQVLNKKVHKSFLKDIRLSIIERQVIYQKLTQYRYNTSIARLKNYCMLTAHSRGFYKEVKLSRHQFNKMVLNGDIPGWFPSSW